MGFTNGERVRVRVKGTGKLVGVRYEFNGLVQSSTANSQVLVVERWAGERYVLFRGWGESSYRDLGIREIEVEVEASSQEPVEIKPSLGTALAPSPDVST